MTEPTSTADYRKYPKGPNFLLIVILFAATILVFCVGAFFFLSDTGRKLLPRLHQSHPTSFVAPQTPSGTIET
ncbi:hypothetical protein [Granulicella arctica]|uniref:hypothetical protein n=1 Tax=Granulicella arctica TaxID=940613 RepID=UPI0021E0B99B|nr:hypothetical protein [Granulicella arctica]